MGAEYKLPGSLHFQRSTCDKTFCNGNSPREFDNFRDPFWIDFQVKGILQLHLPGKWLSKFVFHDINA